MSCPPPCPSPVAPKCGGRPQPPASCRVKPVMRGLHWAQTTRILVQALALAGLAGTSVYLFIGRPRRKAYREYYEQIELEDLADEMARKGLFQAVPSTNLKDFQFCRSQT